MTLHDDLIINVKLHAVLPNSNCLAHFPTKQREHKIGGKLGMQLTGVYRYGLQFQIIKKVILLYAVSALLR